MIGLDIEKVKFDKDGLVPAVVQDIHSGRVLMLAYMNLESLTKTIQTGESHFWSRSRQELWHKGKTSGNKQTLKKVSLDCDGDAILLQVEQQGNACHTGEFSCFHRVAFGEFQTVDQFGEVITGLVHRIHQRRRDKPEDSYTTYLFESGLDKMLKKVGEEAAEIIIAAKNKEKKEIAWEVADLLYHLLVVMEERRVSLSDVAQELAHRAHKKRKEH
ncbi:MAG: bifunctional phosphoribosyl-AMP cyclohydrolase/phosphoribosyl-ATP diphosphatase HisIE [Bacteroidota bacterium]